MRPGLSRISRHIAACCATMPPRGRKRSAVCDAPKGFSQINSCKAKGKIARSAGKYRGRRVKSKNTAALRESMVSIENVLGSGARRPRTVNTYASVAMTQPLHK